MEKGNVVTCLMTLLNGSLGVGFQDVLNIIVAITGVLVMVLANLEKIMDSIHRIRSKFKRNNESKQSTFRDAKHPKDPGNKPSLRK